MNIVIDASAAVGLVLALPGTEIFTPLLEQAALVTAPDLYIAEVTLFVGSSSVPYSLKFVNCISTFISFPFNNWIASWRSSLFLPVTRT